MVGLIMKYIILKLIFIFFSFSIIAKENFETDLIYFTFHLFTDNLNIQKYLVLEFEKKLFEEKQRLINLKIESIDMDLFAMYAEKEDMYDELSKKNYPDPRNGETVLKLD